MSCHPEYARKLKTAEDALGIVQSGMRVFVQGASGFPVGLMNALAGLAPKVRDVEIVHLLTFGNSPTLEPRYAGNFRHVAFFMGPGLREPVRDGRADYVPIHLSEVVRLFAGGQRPVDVALIQVTPPDRHGFVSLGAAVEITPEIARSSRQVIAQVNRYMPRTHGNSHLHVSEISAFVEDSQPLEEFPSPEATKVERAIARHVAGLIEDGSTIQTGIGAVPDAILGELMDRKDLGVHSEVLADSVIPLIEAGVINGRRKTFHQHRVVVGFALGTRRLYDYVNDNPVFEFLPNSYVNDPALIARNERMVAVNSALQIDLTGQVCAESIGQRFYSGFGGQLDFVRGAARSKYGKPVIAISSTAMDGAVSRIVPMLKDGAGVLTTRADVHYVATEFGVVDLHGKSIRQRAELLISIAHPSFQDELRQHCIRARWFQRNEIPANANALSAEVLA